jgi:transcriptional regulator with XRE-family HTH domain
VGNGSVIRQRILGQQLRQLRERRGLSLAEAALRLEMSTSALSRIETGQQTPNVHLMKSMLDEYEVMGDEWAEYLQLTREARQKGWWQAYGGSKNGNYVGLETDATLVREFTIGFPPGLLQTAEYARAMFTASWRQHTEANVENGVRLRMIRQERLTSTDDPLELVAVIDESVLHRNVGEPEVLAGQLAHLAEAAQLPTVTLHVLSFACGRRTTPASGITVLSFGDLGHDDIAYVEHGLGALKLEKEADVHRARLAFDRLRSDALDPADSVALIRRAAEKI